MFRLLTVLAAIVPFACSQNLPSVVWSESLDKAGLDTFAGLGTDRQGNIYVAGSTLSPNFPVKSAVQSQLMTGGLYQINGPGSAYARVGVNFVISSLMADPRNANVLYGTSHGSPIQSVDGGNTWTPLSIPSTMVQSFTIDPLNDQNVYAAAFDIGVLKSTNAGATWTNMSYGLTPCTDCGLPAGQLGTRQIWVDPNFPSVVFVFYGTALARSADGGATWRNAGLSGDDFDVFFDSTNPGVVYVDGPNQVLKSTDDGQTFQGVSIPVGYLVADPKQPGRLLGNGVGTVYESTDDGSTWTARSFPGGAILAADLANGWLYGSIPTSPGIVRVSSDLKIITPVGPPSATTFGLAAAGGRLYDPLSGGHNVFVTKLDPSGNVIYSTYFGGSGDDVASGLAVDSAGGVYVTGRTSSTDFPVTQGAYSASPVNTFLFKLNADGTTAYSTYFAALQANVTRGPSIAVDSAASAYLTSMDSGGLPVTPGAYKTVCGCSGFMPPILGPFIPPEYDGFVTKFDPTGSKLVYSTYLGFSSDASGSYIQALAGDGSVYVTGPGGMVRLNSTGSALLASSAPVVDSLSGSAIVAGSDGNIYLAGIPTNPFQTTPGVFQPNAPVLPQLPAQGGCCASAIVKIDPLLKNVLAATYFGDAYGDQIESLTLDASGNVYVAGYTATRGLPTRTELVEAFGALGYTGFLSELSGDLSTLLFSTYLGDSEYFGVQGVASGANGAIVIAGSTGGSNTAPTPMNVWINSIVVAPPPALRIDSVVNAASLLGGAASPGETVVVNGAGFGSDSQLSIGGMIVPAISITPFQITAVVPSSLADTAVHFEVQSGGSTSNPVFVPVAAASPGLFSVDGSGLGQGYILNQDGTRNTPANPARAGDKITIYATGVGPVSFSDGSAVTASPVSVYIDTVYCNGVSAIMGPVAGFPGSVYQLTVIVPSFSFPSLVGVTLQIGGATSQNGLSISIGG